MGVRFAKRDHDARRAASRFESVSRHRCRLFLFSRRAAFHRRRRRASRSRDARVSDTARTPVSSFFLCATPNAYDFLRNDVLNETLLSISTPKRGVEHPGDIAEAASLSSIALPPCHYPIHETLGAAIQKKLGLGKGQGGEAR